MTLTLNASPTSRLTSAPAIAITIQYCELGNYYRHATFLADELHREFRGLELDFELLPASGGVFEVQVNDRLIFSKRATRRLPEKEEIFYHVQEASRSRWFVNT